MGGAISKVESAQVVLAPNGVVLLRGGSGLSKPVVFISKQEVKYHNVIFAKLSTRYLCIWSITEFQNFQEKN